VKKLLPVYIKSINLLSDKNNIFIISRSPSFSEQLFLEIITANTQNPDKIKVICGNNYEMMSHSDFLVIKSGTSTLESAYIGNPFIICYKANPLSYLIGKKIVKIKYIGLPNILLDKMAVPELIQHEVNAQNISSIINEALINPDKYQKARNDLKEVREILGSKSASHTVSDKILEFLGLTK
jgi:lipid-A-disaccharide synthase